MTPMNFHRFDPIAIDLVENLLPRWSPSSHLRIDLFLPELGVPLSFVVYRPYNYTSVFVDGLVEPRYLDVPDRRDVPGWTRIKNHDSCWTEWHSGLDHEKATLLTQVEVRRVRVWHREETEESKHGRRQDWWTREETEAPSFDVELSVSTFPEWVAAHLALLARYWTTVRGKEIESLEYEFRKEYPSNSVRFLKWSIASDGTPTLVGSKSDFHGAFKPATGTGSFLGDIEKLVTRPWRSEGFSRGPFCPRFGKVPEKGLGV